MGFILLGVVVLILFGTLFPFAPRCPATLELALAGFKPLLRPIGRGDLAANLVLFVPFGLAGMAWARRLPMVWRFLVVVALGFSLSLAVELAQACVPGRASSWSDVALNTLSTAAGALLLPLFRRLFDRHRAGFGHADIGAALLLGAFLIWQLAPFVPAIDWQKWRNALKPLLLQPRFDMVTIASYAVVWLMLARLALAVFRPARPLLVWLALLFLVQAAELIIVGKVLRASELLGGLLGIALAWAVIGRGASPGRDRLLAAAFAGYVVYLGLEPFVFSAAARTFHWIPFYGFLHGSAFVAVQALGQKLFCYGGLIWLLLRAGLGLAPAAILVTLAVLGMEVAQTRLPGRLAEITDPILALIAAGLLWFLRGRGRT